MDFLFKMMKFCALTFGPEFIWKFFPIPKSVTFTVAQSFINRTFSSFKSR